MNLLTSRLPDCVTVNGREYRIRTEFRTWIRFGELCADLAGNIAEILTLCYIDSLPPTLEQAVTALTEFYLCGHELSRKEDTGHKSPIVSFAEDAEYIYSAYLNQYRIDLSTADLHWFQFMALFRSLADDCKISKIMEARAVNLSDIKDKSMKKYYQKMKQAYKLPDRRTQAQKDADLVAALETFF